MADRRERCGQVESDVQPKSNKSECRSETNLSAVTVAEIPPSGPRFPLNLCPIKKLCVLCLPREIYDSNSLPRSSRRWYRGVAYLTGAIPARRREPLRRGWRVCGEKKTLRTFCTNVPPIPTKEESHVHKYLHNREKNAIILKRLSSYAPCKRRGGAVRGQG